MRRRKPGTVSAGRIWWLRRTIWLRRYLPTIIGMVLFAVGIYYSLLYAVKGDWDQLRPRQVMDALILWFCLGPVLVGLIRGWRRTLRRDRTPYPSMPSVGDDAASVGVSKR